MVSFVSGREYAGCHDSVLHTIQGDRFLLRRIGREHFWLFGLATRE